MTGISKASPLPARTETLAGTASSPHGKIIWPSSLLKGVTPDSDAGEEMALGETAEVSGFDFSDVSFINFAIGDQPRLD
jgi:hypothetical protein